MRWVVLLLSLLCFVLPLTAEGAFRDYARRIGGAKRRCHQCNMPAGCSSGSCVGDVCVKTVAAVSTHNVYVSKGCENYTSYSAYPIRYEDGCKQEMVFGVESVICYCSDGDYCNSLHSLPPSLSLLLSLFIALIIL